MSGLDVLTFGEATSGRGVLRCREDQIPVGTLIDQQACVAADPLDDVERRLADRQAELRGHGAGIADAGYRDAVWLGELLSDLQSVRAADLTRWPFAMQSTMSCVLPRPLMVRVWLLASKLRESRST